MTKLSNTLKAKLVVLAVLCIIVVGLFQYASAGGYGDTTNITNYNYGSSGGSNNGSSGEFDRGISNAVCLGMTNFDYDRSPQVSGGASWWKDENSACLAFGNMVDEVLVVGGGACDTGFEDCAGAISFSTHF